MKKKDKIIISKYKKIKMSIKKSKEKFWFDLVIGNVIIKNYSLNRDMVYRQKKVKVKSKNLFTHSFLKNKNFIE